MSNNGAAELFAAAVAGQVQPDKRQPTPAQMAVGYLRIVEGLSPTATAERLVVSIKTEESHLAHLAERLGYEEARAMLWDLHAEYHHRVGYAAALAERRECVEDLEVVITQAWMALLSGSPVHLERIDAGLAWLRPVIEAREGRGAEPIVARAALAE